VAMIVGPSAKFTCAGGVPTIFFSENGPGRL
jgi:hypothetical protein